MTVKNWSKHNFNKAKDVAFKQLPFGGSQHQFYKDSNLWTLKGKHYGSHIHNLPLNYLNWIVDNFKGDTKQQAIDELYRRYQELI